MDIKKPYLLFLGDAHDQLAAKVAIGIKQWHPEYCVGQYRMADCHADCGLPDLDIAAARAAGAQTLVIVVANRGGIISQQWIAILREALESGMDLAAGLHNKLADVPELRELAAKLGRSLFDLRHPTETYTVANGRKLSGKRNACCPSVPITPVAKCIRRWTSKNRFWQAAARRRSAPPARPVF